MPLFRVGYGNGTPFELVYRMEYLLAFMNEHDFPQGAVDCFTALYDKICGNAAWSSEFQAYTHDYMQKPEDIDPWLEKLRDFAKKLDENEYSVDMLFLICCSEELKSRYQQQGIDPAIFFLSMEDLKYKLLECIKCEEVWGTFVAGWFGGFYAMSRFALGRFQYEEWDLDEDYALPDGTVLPKGMPTCGMHIPSSGVSLTKEVRYDSYKKAYDFYREKGFLYEGKLVIECSSWLLYQKHREFLPKHSHILEFMDDFDILSTNTKPGFSNGWRVFGKDSDLPYEQLPEDTSLQRAYKQWLLEHDECGDAHGIIVFDGENIVNRRG